MNNRALVIDVTRGGFIESRHQVIAVISDAKGKRHSQWGDVDQQVFPALPLNHCKRYHSCSVVLCRTLT